MKGKHPRITLLGNNAGNNLGDAAILAAILDTVSKEMPDAEFYVPTICPKFVDGNYGKAYNVKGIDVMPWTLSLRLLGLPTFICLWKSDLALICDGIIFGKKFLNPAFNFLITLVFLIPVAKLFRCKFVCYSCGIGPFPSKLSRWAAKYVISSCDLVIMRDEDSKELARELGVDNSIEVTGDAAFLNLVSNEDKVSKIATKENWDLSKPLLGINVTKYIDGWLAPGERVQDRGAFIDRIADGVNQTVDHFGGELQPVVFSTHPMDEKICEELASKIDGYLVTNSDYLSHDIQGVMRECGVLVGMRFHSLVLSSAVDVPVVGLVYAPKVKGYMRLLDCQDFCLELGDITPESLSTMLISAWENKEELKERQLKTVNALKEGAGEAAVTLKKCLA